jgi:flavodoxin-like protein
MKAVVVYESIYGNTRETAQAIAEGLGGAEVVPVSDAGTPAADLVVVGGPTHMHGMASSRSRQAAADAGHEDGAHVEPEATAEPGLRSWVRDLPDAAGAKAAAFDTRIDKSAWVTGMASRGIARRLAHRGYDVVGSESFLVKESEGPLEEGELDRARAWGAKLAAMLPADTEVTS